MSIKELDPIKEFLSSKHYLSRRISGNFNNMDLEIFRKMAVGDVEGVGHGDRLKALQIVSRSDRQQDFDILSQIIGNESEDSSLRAVAAINMAYLIPHLAEIELIKHLNTQNDLVRSKVIKSLGMIGGLDSYKALLGLENIQPDFVQKQLIFAKGLIAYRLNLDTDPILFIEGLQRKTRTQVELLPMKIELIGPRKIGVSFDRFKGSTYGVDISKSSGFEINIGKAKWILYINKYAGDNGIIKTINSRKMIIGLLSRWIAETKTYAAQYIVFTKPTKNNEVQIMVIRTDGEMLYSGNVTVKKNLLSFSISDIKRKGTAPTKVKGKLTLKGIELEVSIPVSKRERKLSTNTIKPEEFYKRFPKY